MPFVSSSSTMINMVAQGNLPLNQPTNGRDKEQFGKPYVMSMTVDHLRIDHRVTILRDFVDVFGTTMRTGETGIIRKLLFDQIGELIQMEIECGRGLVSLNFALRALEGPRNGQMKEFFELGEDVSVPRNVTLPRQQIIAPEVVQPPVDENALSNPGVDGPDRLEDMEEAMRQKYNHIGVAVSIAEVYAERMRAFRRLGNEPRAVAAFKLAAQWMGTYASWATSGGEGTANSNERDRFCAALVAELGYDPTRNEFGA